MASFNDSDSNWETITEHHLPTDRAMVWAMSEERRSWLQAEGRNIPRTLLLVEVEPAATSTPAATHPPQPPAAPIAATTLPPQIQPPEVLTAAATLPQQQQPAGTSATARGNGRGRNLVRPRPLSATTLSLLGATAGRPSSVQTVAGSGPPIDLIRRETTTSPSRR